MARGALQRAVFEACEAASEPLERQQLKWAVARRLGRVPAERPLAGSTETEAVLPTSFKNSFDRTLAKLREDGRVELRPWQPSSFSEFQGPYSFKTDSTLIQRLRSQLLPLLATALTHRYPGRIQLQEVERRHVQTHGISNAARQTWQALDVQLRALMASATADEAYLLASVLIAMARLQEADEIARNGNGLVIAMALDRITWSGSSLYDCIRVLERKATTTSVVAFVPALQSFYPQLVPPSVRARGTLKNELYEFLGGTDSGSGHLKPEALRLLHEQAPHVLEALPGHRAQRPSYPVLDLDPTDYSPYVAAKLLDRIALRGFARVHVVGET